MWLLELEQLRLDLMGSLLLAAFLGGLVGLEREWNGKPAGFRTNLLICVGAALLTEISFLVADSGIGTVGDPGRIAAQVVSGIGFLGAGTIIQSRAGVTGLTTAATLWVVAAIGIAVGAHAYVEAVGAAVLVVVALMALGKLEGRLVRHAEGVLRVTLARDAELVDRVEEALEGRRLRFRLVEMERGDDATVITYQVSGRRSRFERLVRGLVELEGVRAVKRS